jgi:hypothetical protein
MVSIRCMENRNALMKFMERITTLKSFTSVRHVLDQKVIMEYAKFVSIVIKIIN